MGLNGKNKRRPPRPTKERADKWRKFAYGRMSWNKTERFSDEKICMVG